MSVILITANFKFRNRSTCSKGPIKRAGKVCGDSQDLKSPGWGGGQFSDFMGGHSSYEGGHRSHGGRLIDPTLVISIAVALIFQ